MNYRVKMLKAPAQYQTLFYYRTVMQTLTERCTLHYASAESKVQIKLLFLTVLITAMPNNKPHKHF